MVPAAVARLERPGSGRRHISRANRQCARDTAARGVSQRAFGTVRSVYRAGPTSARGHPSPPGRLTDSPTPPAAGRSTEPPPPPTPPPPPPPPTPPPPGPHPPAPRPPPPAPRPPHPAPRTPHPAPRTPHPAPRTPQGNEFAIG